MNALQSGLLVPSSSGIVTNQSSYIPKRAAGPSDPNWNNVVLLLNGNSLTDAKGRHTLIVNDGTPTVNANGIYLDGASSLRIEDNLVDFRLTAPFTMEGELTGVSAGAATAVFFSNYAGVNGDFELFTRGGPNFNMGFYGDANVFLEQLTPVIIDAPVSWAFTVDNLSMCRLFVNGVVIASGVAGGGGFDTGSLLPVFIGRENAGSTKFFKGSLRLRVTKGVCRYADTYTPPAWPLPAK